MKELIVEAPTPYPVRIGRGLGNGHSPAMDELKGKCVLIVTDDNVARFHLDAIKKTLSGGKAASLVLSAGETHKNWQSCEKIFGKLIEMRADRSVVLLALGGGMIGDVVGFAAACWMRGVDYWQLPTSLLAMVDSSVGGKTALNFQEAKNLVGAFHHPRAVLADVNFLETLPEREFRSGFAEAVKYGAIGDAAFFEWMGENAPTLCARDRDALAELALRCCARKAAVVARDERDRGDRLFLNFGHTFAHALEAITDYRELLHGEAVALGIALAGKISERIGFAEEPHALALADMLGRFELPTQWPVSATAQALARAIVHDKKKHGDDVDLVLLRRIGRTALRSVPLPELEALLEEIMRV